LKIVFTSVISTQNYCQHQEIIQHLSSVPFLLQRLQEVLGILPSVAMKRFRPEALLSLSWIMALLASYCPVSWLGESSPSCSTWRFK